MRIERSFAYVISLLLFVFSRCAFAQESSNGDTLLWDGLENSNNWSVNSGGDITMTPDYKTEGNNSLAVNVSGQPPADGIILRKESANLDVSFANKIVLDIYNSGLPCQVSLAFDTGNVHESVTKVLNSGLNKNVTFEISPKDFKASFDYEGVAKNVMFIIYPNDGSVGPVYFDNIRIKKYGGLKYEAPNISPRIQAAVQTSIPEESPVDYGTGYTILDGQEPEGSDIVIVAEHKTVFIFGLGLAGLLFYRKKT